MKKTVLFILVAMICCNLQAAEIKSDYLVPSVVENNSGRWHTLYAYVTYQALLEVMSDVPKGSIVVIKYAKFKESPENEDLNETLKDLVVDILVKQKMYRVIRDAQMAPKDADYYEVYVMADYAINPNESYDKNDCEGNYCYTKAEVIKKSTGEVVASSRKQAQMQCGKNYERTIQSFDYIRFQEEYQVDW